MALSGVAMISFSTFADASIRLAISESFLSAAQLTPMNIEQRLSTKRHLGIIEEIRLISVSSSVLV
jgi:hypothetical protein